MEFLMAAFFALIAPIILWVIAYFCIVQGTNISPKGIGVLVSVAWSTIIVWLISYLIFLSPPIIRGHFSLGDSIGFWSAVSLGAIIIVVLWIKSIKK